MRTHELTAVQRVRAHELSWLLGAADKNDLWQEPDGTSVQTDAEYFGLADPIGEVTEEVRLAESAGLLRPRPLRQGSGAAWELTDAGRIALDLDRGVTRPKATEGEGHRSCIDPTCHCNRAPEGGGAR